ncbi:MAG: GDSL-type esterase/lipase family protein [Planctomycetota bacterium]|nr:GDSL-type esterase/lipase family protein [Planctomycetota bacterium]
MRRLALGVGSTLLLQATVQAQFELRQHDVVAIVGNALAERMLHDGSFEARVQLAHPDLGVSVRNLGFSGDEVVTRQRTNGFGTPDEHLTQVGATVVIGMFGYGESFRGPEGLETFRGDLGTWVEHVRSRQYDGRAAEGLTRIALVASIPFEDLGNPLLPEAAAQNARISAYNGVIAEVARAQRVPFADVYTPMLAAYQASAEPLTIDGIHLNERGNAAFARVLAQALLPGAAEPDAARLAAVRTLVAAKDARWFRRHHVADGYNVFGERSLLTYNDQTNREVMQRELEWLDAECANLDSRIWEQVRGLPAESLPRVPVPPQIPVPTNRPGDGPNGAHRFLSGSEAIGRMTPGKGLDVTLFADESRFPDLAKPVQMSFDTRGRLWVAVWPSYPNSKPDEPARDKLLVLEDVDGDGRADTCKAFVSDLHNPTGFEFWNGGVFVATAPNLQFLRDTDGDGVCDSRENVLEGLASADTHHSSNSFVLGPDGALYFQEGIFHRTQVETVHGVVRQRDGCAWRYEPRTRRLERYAPYGFLNPHGHVFDAWGQDFITDGTGNENFYALPITGALESPQQHPRIDTFFEQRSRPAGGTEILSGGHFPSEMLGDYLIANVIGFQGIFRYHLRDDGSGFGADEREPIVYSADPNFRPVDLEIGPDGALYFLDWQNPLIGHMQHHLRDPSRDHVHGRVYRVTARGRPLVKPVAIAGRPIPELIDLLKSPEDRVRYRSRIELSSRPSKDVVEAARTWAGKLDPKEPGFEHHRLEALWLQAQHHVLDRELLGSVLRSPEPRARAAATRVVRNLRREIGDPLPFLARSVQDEHPRVRLEALVALSFVPTAAAAETTLRVLAKPMDANLEYSLTETMRALEPMWRAEVAQGGTFAASDPKAQAWVLSRTETDVLLAQKSPSAALYAELLGRHGLEPEQYELAARGLATLRSTRAVGELAAAIARADQQEGGHTDHLLSGLFQALPKVAQREFPSDLADLRQTARRSATRRLATAAWVDHRGSFEDSWTEALTPQARTSLLEAVPFVHDEFALQSVFPRVLGVLDAPVAGTSRAPTRGRYLRVELAGPKRTLTLAEVEVFDGATNVARSGRASQSTTNWNGSAERAIDGNTSGAWADDGQTHTIEDRPDPWWELDLGDEVAVDRVVIWNRTDESLGKRLQGVRIALLDGDRRLVQDVSLPDVAASATWSLVDNEMLVRRAAASALGALAKSPDRAAPAAKALADRAFDPSIGSAAIGALRTIPVARWPAGTAKTVALDLTQKLAERAAAHVDRGWLALADELTAADAGIEPKAVAELRIARRRAGPKVAVLRPVPDSLTYDRALIVVAAGRPVELVFENVDIMPHNLVVAARGALAKVGMAAEAMNASPDAWSKNFVPDMPEVLHASKLLQPGTTETLAFIAPTELGDYPYVCTFPGHWIRMNGILRVVASEDGAEESAIAQAGPTRKFVRNWRYDELAQDTAKISTRDAARGRAVFEAASCLSCHKVDDVGGTTGPELRGVVARYTPAEILQNVLDPSKTIAPEFVAEILQTTDGRVVAGRIVSQDARTVRVQVDPYGGVPVELALEDVEDRATSKVSVMPSGLLSTFERAEILDLLAYLVSLKR